MGFFAGGSKKEEEKIKILSSVNDLENRLAEILKKDFSGYSQDQILSTLNDKLVYFPLHATYSIPYNIERYPVYRVRMGIDESKEDITHIRTFSYPSSKLCESNGRANLRYRPVFYCSDIPGTALAEMKPQLHQTIYLSEWLVRCNRSDVSVNIFPANLPSQNTYITIARNRYSEMLKHFEKRYNKEISEKVKRIFDFLGELFISEKPPYLITSCLTNHFLYGKFGIDYIIYPSYQTTAYSCNIAFNPNFADQYLKISKVFKFRIMKQYDHKGVALYMEKVADYFQDALVWREPRKDDAVFAPIFSKEEEKRMYPFIQNDESNDGQTQ
jgi:hypothetical protein